MMEPQVAGSQVAGSHTPIERSSPPFRKILIANRGEIALRIMRTCRELGIKSVLIHSEADRNSLPVRMADETVCVGPAAGSKSYLNTPNIITAALTTNADAIHPGYGFLSENYYFAEICEKCQVTFIGPKPDVISLMSDKAVGRQTMAAAGVPILPGSVRPLRSLDEVRELADEIGYPVILKASAGGGGRGMRIISSPDALGDAFSTAQIEAQSAFGNGQLILEKYLTHCRHIEVQVLGDTHGNVISLGERDCTVQRRHQKLIEEAPSPALTTDQRQMLVESAVRGARAVGYTSAGTLEFLMDVATGNLYFIEMNTRIQVEHGVTELICGLDLVAEQIRVAAGERLSVTQDQVQLRGHAIECRITAEDAARDFRPQFGTVTSYLPPGGPGIRVDSHLYGGYTVPVHYDSLLSKVMGWGQTREEALARVRRAVGEYQIEGLTTTLPFHHSLLGHPTFMSGNYANDMIEQWQTDNLGDAPVPDAPVAVRRTTS